MEARTTGLTKKSFAAAFFKDLRDAVAGREHEYTSGSLGRAILLLAVPMVLEMVMESIFAVTDVFFVARLGEEATATVGLTESVLTLVFALAIGLSMATTAMVARRIGEKRKGAARVAAIQALFLGILISLPIMICGIFFASDILRLMGASQDVISMGTTYTTIMLSSNVIIIFLFLINAIFRGAGNAAIAMRVLWMANGINIVLDPCLIFGLGPFPELGVTGAAVATTIGRGVGVLFQISLLFRGRGSIQITHRHITLNLAVMLRLLRVSAWGIIQWIIATSSWMVLVRIVAVFGSAAIAGYTIAIRVVIFTILPSWGLSNAAATLVGQNLGAKQPDRAARSVWITSIYNMVFLGLVAVVFISFPQAIIGLFTNEPEVLRQGSNCIRYLSYGYLFFALGMVMAQAFNGAGDTFTPTALNFVCYWLIQIPVAYQLAIPGGWESTGVFTAIVVADICFSILAVWVFRRGKWKTQEI